MSVATRNNAQEESKVAKLKSRYQQQSSPKVSNEWPMLLADDTSKSRKSGNQNESINTSSGSSSGYNSHTHLLHHRQQHRHFYHNQKQQQQHQVSADERHHQELSIASGAPTLASQVSQQIESSLQLEKRQKQHGYPSQNSYSMNQQQVSGGRRQVAANPTIRRESQNGVMGAKPLPLPPLPLPSPPPLPMNDKLYFVDDDVRGSEDLIDEALSGDEEDDNSISRRYRPTYHQHYPFERRRSDHTASCLESTEDNDDDGYEEEKQYLYSQNGRHPQHQRQLYHHHQSDDDDLDELSFSQVQHLPSSSKYNHHHHQQQAVSRYHNHNHSHNHNPPLRQHNQAASAVEYLSSRRRQRPGNLQRAADDQFAYNPNAEQETNFQHRGEFAFVQPLRSQYNNLREANQAAIEANQKLLPPGEHHKSNHHHQQGDLSSKQSKAKGKMQHNSNSNSRQNLHHSSNTKSNDEYQHKSLASRQRQFQQELTRKQIVPSHNSSKRQVDSVHDDEQPALSICGKFAKFLLFITNIIFWSTGIALCAWGVLSLVEDHKYSLSQLLVFDSSTKMSLFQLLSWSFITLGCATVLVGFCGCSAMLKNNRWILGLYIFLILAIFALDLATGLLAIIFQERLVANVRLRLVSKLRTDYGVQASFTAAVDYIQTRFECCGMEGHFDYDQSLWRLQRLGGYEATVARTCCHLRNTFDDQAHINPRPVNESMCQSTDVRFHQSYRYRKGCLDDLERLVRQKIWTFTVGCGAAGGIILLSLLFSTCFCRSIPEAGSSRKSSTSTQAITVGTGGSRASSKSNKHKKQTAASNHHRQHR